MKFRLESTYKPSGDQPGAIEGLCEALSQGVGDVTLLGVTGSGKTFTMANVIERLQRPALILSHNKTLAAQLYGEFKSFFPSNAVEYFVSYYDYYQPEAYLPTTDTYIEKDLSINDQIDKLRKDIDSVSTNPERSPFEIHLRATVVRVNQMVKKPCETALLAPLDHNRLSVKVLRVADAVKTGHTARERSIKAVSMIQDDLKKQVDYFNEIGKGLEAKRLQQRVENDLEMIKEMGYCPGIENYSRYLDGRQPGQRPFCLIDYFPKDFITFIDESHVTIPQIRAMYGGDHARKSVLIEYGFRLPAASDNRPLTFDEFNSITGQKVYVSATPSDYELERSDGLVVEQVVRPTGLLDPPIEVRPTKNQVDDLVEEIRKRAEKDERVLVTTLTKRMAEELTDYLDKIDIRVRYIHSDVDTGERVEIIEDFKNGLFDVLVGVNLLREGLDIPTVRIDSLIRLAVEFGHEYIPFDINLLRGDVVEFVIFNLLRPAAVGLADGLIHRLGDCVGIHYHKAVSPSGLDMIPRGKATRPMSMALSRLTLPPCFRIR